MRKGKGNAHRQRHARILLLADTNGPEGGWSDSRIAGAGHTSIPTVERVRGICVEHGLERAREPKDLERESLRKLYGKGEAELIAQGCGPAPEGRARWTLRLLAAHLGVDAESGLVHTVVGTAANFSDISQTHELLHGPEKTVHADGGYIGVEKRAEIFAKHGAVEWRIAAKRSKIKALPECWVKDLALGFEKLKARARAG